MIGTSEVTKKSILSKDSRRVSQGYVDLEKKSKTELEELLERQNKLLLNRWFTLKLPDKGEKLKTFKRQVENELNKRKEDCDATCSLLCKLTLNNPEDIEWNQGKLKNAFKNEKQLGSDDEDEKSIEADPLRLVATHSGTINGSKVICKDSNNLNTTRKLFYVDKFCEKYGKTNTSKERFKPNQLKNDAADQFVRSAEKVKQKFGDKWEVTQATPPIPIFKNTVMISLSESLKLQKQQAEKLKEVEKKYATERLLQNIGVKIGDKLPVTNFKEYRLCTNDFDETAEDEEDSNDSENEDKEKKFFFPIVNKES